MANSSDEGNNGGPHSHHRAPPAGGGGGVAAAGLCASAIGVALLALAAHRVTASHTSYVVQTRRPPQPETLPPTGLELWAHRGAVRQLELWAEAAGAGGGDSGAARQRFRLFEVAAGGPGPLRVLVADSGGAEAHRWSPTVGECSYGGINQREDWIPMSAAAGACVACPCRRATTFCRGRCC